jgi:hypothetical protein
MNDQYKEAFDKWFIKTYRYDYKDLVIPESVNPQKEAWQAAIEYERFNHKYCVVGSLDKLCEKLEAENKKLRDALEFYANNQTTMTTENGIYLRDGLNGNFFSLKEKARRALKEVDEL